MSFFKLKKFQLNFDIIYYIYIYFEVQKNSIEKIQKCTEVSMSYRKVHLVTTLIPLSLLLASSTMWRLAVLKMFTHIVTFLGAAPQGGGAILEDVLVHTAHEEGWLHWTVGETRWR